MASYRKCLRLVPVRSPVDVGLVVVALLVSLLLHPADLRAGHDRPPRGLTRREARTDAIDAIPMRELSREVRNLIAPMVEGSRIHRRLSTEVLRCDPRLYRFLVEQPDVMVAIWKVLGVSRVSLKRVGPDRYELRDGRGLAGRLRLLYRSPHLHLLWFEGTYRGPLSARPISASVLLQLRSAFIRETDQHMYVAHRLDAFVKLDSEAAGLLTRLLEPLTASQANKNFSQIGNFMAVLSALIAQHPNWGLHLVSRLDGISSTQQEELRRLVQVLSREQRAAPTALTVQGRSRDSGKPGKATVGKPRRAQEKSPARPSRPGRYAGRGED